MGLRTNHGDFTRSASDDFDDSKSDEDQDHEGEGEGSDSEEEEDLKNGEENDVAESEVHQVGEDDDEESEDGRDENDDEGGKGTLRSKLRKWSEERKELHRQQVRPSATSRKQKLRDLLYFESFQKLECIEWLTLSRSLVSALSSLSCRKVSSSSNP